jgi:hypothetical protein
MCCPPPGLQQVRGLTGVRLVLLPGQGQQLSSGSGPGKGRRLADCVPRSLMTWFPPRFVGYPGNHHTLFGVRNEEVSELRQMIPEQTGLGTELSSIPISLSLLSSFLPALLPSSKPEASLMAAPQDSRPLDHICPRTPFATTIHRTLTVLLPAHVSFFLF